MQVIRLVKPGIVDKVIAFDSLPEDILHDMKSKKPKVDTLSPKETKMGRDWDNFSPVQYVLQYKNINKDKEVWAEIVNYVNQNVKSGFRLRDLVEMAVSLAPDAHSQMTLEPESVPIVPLEEENTKIIPVSVPREINVSLAKESVPVPGEIPSHSNSCVTKARGGKLTAGCPKCEYLKSQRKEPVTA